MTLEHACEGCGEEEGIRFTDDDVWVCDGCWDASLVPICPFCGGEGWLGNDPCMVCDGIGAAFLVAASGETKE